MTIATVADAFRSASTRKEYQRAKRLACALTGAEQLAIVDAAIAASQRLAR